MTTLEQYRISGRSASEVALSIETGLREGRLGSGELLPTVRALASRLELSPATVAAAYQKLRQRGLIVGLGRHGTRVSGRPPLPSPRVSLVPRGARDVMSGNPDPALLPRLPALARQTPRLYGEGAIDARLQQLAQQAFRADGVPAESLAVLGGALDAIERVLQAHLRPGDRVGVEDPGYTGVLDLLAALGLAAEPIGQDDRGVLPRELERALRLRLRAGIFTPRAQNPTGSAWDVARVRELRQVLQASPELLVIEDDHAGAVSGAAAHTLCDVARPHWAVVRSVSKWLGPDLRLALVAGDATTIARVQGRQAVGAGWVSHVLQRLVARLWGDRAVTRRLDAVAGVYRERREGLIEALASHGLRGHGRSGFNVWVPVPDESDALALLAHAGFAARAGERYRIASPPAIRITSARLLPADARRIAAALAPLARPAPGPGLA